MLGEKKGDQQARAELLGMLLIEAGEAPFWTQVAIGKDRYCLLLIRVIAKDQEFLKSFPGGAPKTIKVGADEFLPLSLEPGAKIGDLPEAVYDAATGRWKASMSLTRFP